MERESLSKSRDKFHKGGFADVRLLHKCHAECLPHIGEELRPVLQALAHTADELERRYEADKHAITKAESAIKLTQASLEKADSLLQQRASNIGGARLGET